MPDGNANYKDEMKKFDLKSQDRLVDLKQIDCWMQESQFSDAMVVKSSTLLRSNSWVFTDGSIQHVSKRFFSVIGVEWSELGKTSASIFLEQREIGTLGVIARRSNDGLEILLNAKAEPGNFGFVQLAPTCQATASNADQVHGGTPPPFSNYFLSPHGEIISDSLQSEHGMRFFGKLNRNIFIVDCDSQELTAQHRWVSFRLLASMLDKDFRVNTDLRSVLCCTDWACLAGGVPFAEGEDFAQELRKSFLACPRPHILAAVLKRLDELRCRSKNLSFIDVRSVAGFSCSFDTAPTLSNGAQSLQHIEVQSCLREVHAWDQPILEDTEEQVIDLFCARGSAGLVFAFRAQWEPGLVRGAELAPTVQGPKTDSPDFGNVRLSVRQSDEGGRFYHCISNYRIIDVGEVIYQDDYLWLTLAEIRVLLSACMFNNESRSALSLLLRYL
mgnify:CR=1 FL=1